MSDTETTAQQSPYEIAARAAGWRHGGDCGGIIYNGKLFSDWKDATSWAGDDPSDKARDESSTYDTWQECCEGEDIEVTL